MIDLKLDANGDLDLATRDLAIVSGVEEVGQGLGIGLRSVKGEYVLDRRQGLDLFGRVLGRQEDEIRDAEIKREILDRPGVAELISYQAAVNDLTRELQVDFVARADDGQELQVDGQAILLPAPPEIEEEVVIPVEDPLELALSARPVFNAAGGVLDTFPYSEEAAELTALVARVGVADPVVYPRPVEATEDV